MRNPYTNLFGALAVLGVAYLYANRAKLLQMAEDLNIGTYIRDGFDNSFSFIDDVLGDVSKDSEAEAYRKYAEILLNKIAELENRVK